MASAKQAGKRKTFYSKRFTSRTPALQSRPQVKGIITRVTTMSPKKTELCNASYCESKTY
jgi:ribosomal protein S12